MPHAARRRFELTHDRGATRLVVVAKRDEVAPELADWTSGREVFVITSAPVWAMHGEATLGDLAPAAQAWTVLEIPDGEAAKSLSVALSLWERMLEAGARRDSRVLTLGGGSVCDLGAFVAATYMRGVAFSHVPSTLLAQVDAAIGGKSAINLEEAKNVVGVFSHPARIVSATDLLATLPQREIRAGLVEAIKVAALRDGKLFAEIESQLDVLLEDPEDHLLDEDASAVWRAIVEAAQRVKVDVVMRDPLEAGDRRVLNFGHTLGHALEVTLGYGALAHGEAVAYGIYFALQLAATRGLDPQFQGRLEAILDRLRLPPLPRPSLEATLAALARDKKAGPEGVVWVLPTGLGAWEAVALPAQLVAAELSAFMAQRCEAC